MSPADSRILICRAAACRVQPSPAMSTLHCVGLLDRRRRSSNRMGLESARNSTASCFNELLTIWPLYLTEFDDFCRKIAAFECSDRETGERRGSAQQST